ncbi:MAG: DMT family transporter [Deltaproteobacteria bacterium]|nr:DMT family transporter [Deltaproteobacteria bacterium]
MSRNHVYSIIQALIAALLFGASAPLAKLLLGEVEPIPLASFLYLGSGIGLLGIKAYQRTTRQPSDNEAQIKKSDYSWLAGAVLAGGVAAPITLLFSLQNTPAATASLLLNFEGVATTLIASFAFKESISRRAWWAIALITLSTIFLSININASWGFSVGALGIIAACVLWGIDNNFTQKISSKDPLMIVTIKGLVAGSFSLGIAIFLDNKIPAPDVILGALVLGSLSYGVSIVLFIHAMRGLGAARTSALFSTAPLSGMILSFFLFCEFPDWMFIVALPTMFIGTLFLVREEHEHHHIHGMTFHEHSHVHDDKHHEHDHEGEYVKKHSHTHSHNKIAHSHHHMPDLHHRHIHSSEEL